MASRLAAVAEDSTGDAAETAGLGPRLLAYLLDSVVLFGFTMVFATIAGSIIFISSSFGEENPSDGAFLALVVVLLATMPAWLLFTLALFWWRGQSVGQYLMGLEITRDDSGVPSNGQLAAYSVLLHPIVFHPIMAVLWLYEVYQSVVVAASSILLVAGLVMGVLCVLAPLASLLFAAADRRRRGLHDRLAGMRVVKVAFGE